MKVNYFGHSCFLVDYNGAKLLFDPFISPNPLANVVNITELNPDYILVSHAHEDHIADLITIAKQSNAKVIAVWEIHAWLQNQGVTNTHPMNTGGIWKFEHFSVQLIQAVHSSSFPDGTYGGNPVGFVVFGGDKTLYYSGDTALFWDMKLIPMRYSLDVAFLPIGSNFTMDMHDAAIAAEWLGVNKVFGMHYDTFGFIKIDHHKAKQVFEEKGIVLSLLPINREIEL